MSIANIRYPNGTDFPLGCESINEISATELSYLEGARANLQAQIDAIDPNPIFLNPPGDILVISNTNGIISSTDSGAPVTVYQAFGCESNFKVGSIVIEPDVTSCVLSTTELSYLSGARENIQSQIDGIGTPPTLLPAGDMVVVSSSNSIVSSSSYGSKVTISQDLGLGNLTIHNNGGTGTLTTTELSYVEGATANLQAQIDALGAPVVLNPPGDIVVVSSINSPISSTDYSGSMITINKNSHFMSNVEIGSVNIATDATTGNITTTELSYLAGANANIQAQIDSIGAPVTLTPAGDIVVASSTGSPVTSTDYTGTNITINKSTLVDASSFVSICPSNQITIDSTTAFRVNDGSNFTQFQVDTQNKRVQVSGENTLDKFDVLTQAGEKVVQVDTANKRMYLNGLSLNMPYSILVQGVPGTLVSTYPTYTQFVWNSIPYETNPFNNTTSTLQVPATGLYSVNVIPVYILGSTAAATRDYWLSIKQNDTFWLPYTIGYPGVAINSIGGFLYGNLALNTVFYASAGDIFTFYTAVGSGGTGTVNISQFKISMTKIS